MIHVRASHIVSLVLALVITAVVAAGTMFGSQLNKQTNVQGSGKPKTETRNVGAFTNIVASGAYNIEVQVGSKQSLKITADDNLLPILTTKVSNGTLELDSTKSYSTKTSIKVVITVPRLNDLTIAGAGNVNVKNLNSAETKFLISGSGTVVATGSAKHLSAEVTGSGNIELDRVASEKVDARITGSGNINVRPIKSLQAVITGSGNIVYVAKEGLSVSKQVSGSGSIRAK